MLIPDQQHLQNFIQNSLFRNRPPAVYLLTGQFGSGKTTFVRSFCELLKVQENVSSPSFNLKNIYYGEWSIPKENITIYHLDFYRLQSAYGLPELTETEDNNNFLFFMEWAFSIRYDWKAWADSLPASLFHIHFMESSGKHFLRVYKR